MRPLSAAGGGVGAASAPPLGGGWTPASGPPAPAQEPTWSPCARGAGTAGFPMQMLCAFSGFPGGMWHTSVFLPLAWHSAAVPVKAADWSDPTSSAAHPTSIRNATLPAATKGRKLNRRDIVSSFRVVRGRQRSSDTPLLV